MTPRARPLALLCAVTVLGSAAAAAAANVVITASGMSFSPANVTIHPGDSVTWKNAGGTHNVRADDDSFRCAQGCDDQGGDGAASAVAWQATRTFTAEGTVAFHCEIHGSVGGGMHGTVVVDNGGGGGGGDGHPGSLRFSLASYGVTEGTAQAQVAVTRTGGDDGAVGVHYATSAQTATAGSDFTNVSGTLDWAASDDAPKSFAVPIANDALAEGNETLLLTLSAPTGGATLGAPTAQLTIFDNDSGGSVPLAPARLHAVSTTATGVVLGWKDRSNNETRFRVEGRRLDETAFVDRGTRAANAAELAIAGLTGATPYVFRVRAENAAGASGFSEEVLVTTDAVAGPCVAGATTLCLNGGRFRATVDWRTAQSGGHAGAIPLPANPDSGLFFFFDADNIEALIKVLNACAFSAPRYWTFFAATTNVEFTLTVTDTANGKTKTYFNRLDQAALPVQDTDAFATCP